MAEISKKLKTVLEGYATFLRKRELVLPRHQQHLVRWGQEFLLFAEQHPGYTFQQTLDLFLVAVEERVGTSRGRSTSSGCSAHLPPSIPEFRRTWWIQDGI